MEFHPMEFTDERQLEKYKKIPLTEISGLGAAFAEFKPEFRTAAISRKINVDGLYRCTFPRGIAGQLAQFKDKSGFTGTIMNHGIAGQARWNPVNSVFATAKITVPVSPLNLFMDAAMIEMDHKLSCIETMGKNILSYQKEKDKAVQEANFETLVDVYNKYKYNLQDEKWQLLKYADVQQIHRETSARIKQLRQEIEKEMDKHDPAHNIQQTRQMVANVQENFYMYRLAVFMYAFSTFLEVILHGNFSEGYLNEIESDIKNKANEYKSFYFKCYDSLRHSSNTTVGSNFLKGLSNMSSNAGRMIHKIPVIEKGPLDEALMSLGSHINDRREKDTDKEVSAFEENMTSGAGQFADEIHQINRLYNRPMDVLIDRDNIYLRID